MTRSSIRKNLHSRINNMLRHAGASGYTRDEWALHGRIAVADVEAGAKPKDAARCAVAGILRDREAVREVMNLTREPIAHEMTDAERIFAQV